MLLLELGIGTSFIKTSVVDAYTQVKWIYNRFF